MPFHRPIPNAKPRPGSSTGFGAMVEAEKLMQVAFVLPSAVVIGWLGGAWLDHLFHQKWIAIAGIVLGSISGLSFVIQMAFAAMKKIPDDPQDGNGKSNLES